ncbi:MAG: hypothetical protein F6K16_28895 [Symploca sp. SIO2B6]|nr:hypothetical protein [Symploca sp. SIO2B6]
MKEKGKRYSIKFLNTPEFLHEVNRIVDAIGDETLIIECSEAEIKQFDISEKNNWFRLGL